MASNHQKEIIALLQKRDMKLNEIAASVSFQYHNNQLKYVGEILKRMIDNGQVARVARGVYSIDVAKAKANKQELNQSKNDQLTFF